MSLQKYNENKTNLNFWSYLNNFGSEKFTIIWFGPR